MGNRGNAGAEVNKVETVDKKLTNSQEPPAVKISPSPQGSVQCSQPNPQMDSKVRQSVVGENTLQVKQGNNSNNRGFPQLSGDQRVNPQQLHAPSTQLPGSAFLPAPLVGYPPTTDNVVRQSELVGENLLQANQGNSNINRGLPQQGYFSGQKATNSQQLHAPSTHPPGSAFLPFVGNPQTAVESFKQNINQQDHAAFGGNLINNQHQADGHARNISPAELIQLFGITEQFPQYPTGGASNPTLNPNIQEVLGAVTVGASIPELGESGNIITWRETELPEWDQLAPNLQLAGNCMAQALPNQNLNAVDLHNLLAGPVTNSLYHPLYKVFGEPVDPHLRLFQEKQSTWLSPKNQ